MKSQNNTLKRSVLHEGQSRKLEYVESGAKVNVVRSNQQ